MSPLQAHLPFFKRTQELANDKIGVITFERHFFFCNKKHKTGIIKFKDIFAIENINRKRRRRETSK
jgi:hypothetical protein